MQADFQMSEDSKSVEKYDGQILMSPRSMEMLDGEGISINDKGEIKYPQKTYCLRRGNYVHDEEEIVMSQKISPKKHYRQHQTLT